MARPFLLAFASWCLLALAGCDDSESFLCLDHVECGEDAVCEDNGSCSFVDPTCESGRRYGEYAPGRIAETCVVPDSAADSTPDPEPDSVPSSEPIEDIPAPSGVCAQTGSCELCLACTAFEAPCADHVVTCSSNDACLDGLTCGQACLAYGECEDCCEGADAEDRDLIATLNTCQLSECGALCGGTRVPECSAP